MKAIDRAKLWLSEDYDLDTRNKVQELINENGKELEEAFYKNLEFGTGGLRGIMGVGTNRMNKYTVAMATQGICNYLKQCYPNKELSAAIAHDCRLNSSSFAKITADIFTANGIKVYLFDDLRPTPELSFAIRHFKCDTGVVITASHNPKEYNGFKAYWNDGAQIIAPHDVKIVEEVKKITSLKDVNWNKDESLITMIGRDVDKIYLDKVKELTLHPEAIKQNSDLSIVYTPLHGAGQRLIPEALKMYGFNNVTRVEEQSTADGHFPTVDYPNPEDPKSFKLALELAKEKDAALVIASDPDADRIGIAVKNDKGDYTLLNGNQTGALLFYYIIKNRKPNNKPYFVVKTIVTSDVLNKIAESENIQVFECLTGFKHIATVIREHEDDMKFLVGGEESYGYLCADFVRDKDAIMSSCLIAEAAAWAKTQDMSLLDLLNKIYDEFGHYQESLKTEIHKGKEGVEIMNNKMVEYRNNPPKEIEGHKVIEIRDYQTKKIHNLVDGSVKDIDLPQSNVLQFYLDNGTKISVRPSGTEPKIKYYRSDILRS